MKKRGLFFTFLALLLVLSTACGAKEQMGSSPEPDDMAYGKDDYVKVISGNNELGFKLLEEVEADENGNVFISPMSLLMALSMVYNGAEGITKEEIGDALQLKGIEVDELNRANASLRSILRKNSDQIQLTIANSIWINERFHFQKKFAQNNEKYFGAKVEEIDISDLKAPKRINEWVKERTNDKIEGIVDETNPLYPDFVALLINAIHFNGQWTYAFDEKQTKNRPFRSEDGTEKSLPLMVLNKELAYMETEQFQAVALPYGDGEMSMKVFLPKENVDMEKFKELLTVENWDTWNAAFQKEEGTVLLPKFKLEYEVLLNEALQALGMKSHLKKRISSI